jgi:hypothetical protein
MGKLAQHSSKDGAAFERAKTPDSTRRKNAMSQALAVATRSQKRNQKQRI